MGLEGGCKRARAILSRLSTNPGQTFSDQIQGNGLLDWLNVAIDQLGTLGRLGLQQQVGRVDIDPANIRQVILNHLRVMFGNDPISHPVQIKNGDFDCR